MRFYGGHREGPFFSTPRSASLSVSLSYEHTRRRTRTLAEAGLLEKHDTNYRITDLGLRYVNGEMDEEELEALNPDAAE